MKLLKNCIEKSDYSTKHSHCTRWYSAMCSIPRGIENKKTVLETSSHFSQKISTVPILSKNEECDGVGDTCQEKFEKRQMKVTEIFSIPGSIVLCSIYHVV